MDFFKKPWSTPLLNKFCKLHPIKIVPTKYEGGHKPQIDQISYKNYPVPSELPQPIMKGRLEKRPLAPPGPFTGVHIFGVILLRSSIIDMQRPC